MNEDEVLARMRDHVRDERAEDAALEAVARGEPDAELERAARTDATAAALLAASRPLGPEVEARIAARLAGTSAEGSGAARPRRNAGARVLPFLRRAAVWVGPAALAAAVLVYMTARGPGGESAARLPDYAVTVSSDQAMRGPGETSADARLTLRGGPDASFEIVARPATNAEAKVVAYAFAMGEGEPNPVEARVEIAPGGSIRIRGRARALLGAREVRVVVGTASDSIHRFEDALSRAREGRSDASVRVLSIPIVRE